MPIETIIEIHFGQVAAEQGKILAPLKPDTMLVETGMDSLCMAIIVARLEDVLGVDPFGAADDMEFPITFGDFINLYKKFIE